MDIICGYVLAGDDKVIGPLSNEDEILQGSSKRLRYGKVVSFSWRVELMVGDVDAGLGDEPV